MKDHLESKGIAAIVVEDDFDGSLSERVAGVTDAMKALKTAAYNTVLIRPDEIVIRRRKDRRRWSGRRE